MCIKWDTKFFSLNKRRPKNKRVYVSINFYIDKLCVCVQYKKSDKHWQTKIHKSYVTEYKSGNEQKAKTSVQAGV